MAVPTVSRSPSWCATALQQLIELEDAALLGAKRHERSEERLGYRNGYRPRLLTTQGGDIDLRIPKLCSGSFAYVRRLALVSTGQNTAAKR